MGRPKGIWTPDVVRGRIQATKLIQRLQKHALGEVEMTATQIRAAEVVLKKKVPDLSAVEHSGQLAHRHEFEMTDAELARIAAGSSAGTAEASSSTQEPPPVH